MPSKPGALSERISAYYAQLSSAANTLNAVSDELGKSIVEIDAALKSLNLGITVWVRISGWSSNGDRGDTSWWSEDLGYAKVKGKWGVCLRRIDGDHRNLDQDDEESWPFNEAPRSLRLDAIDKLPELLEALSSEAAKVTVKIQEKLSEAKAVASAVTSRPQIFSFNPRPFTAEVKK